MRGKFVYYLNKYVVFDFVFHEYHPNAIKMIAITVGLNRRGTAGCSHNNNNRATLRENHPHKSPCCLNGGANDPPHTQTHTHTDIRNRIVLFAHWQCCTVTVAYKRSHTTKSTAYQPSIVQNVSAFNSTYTCVYETN